MPLDQGQQGQTDQASAECRKGQKEYGLIKLMVKQLAGGPLRNRKRAPAVYSLSIKSSPLLRAAPSFTFSRLILSSSSRSNTQQRFSSDAVLLEKVQFESKGEIDSALLDNVQTELEGEVDAVSDSAVAKVSNSEVIKTGPRPPLPPSQQVGIKSGVTDTVIGALIETLEKNELLKLKIHGT
ncbi:hypothetical protein SASPL_145402 [Salvia splendens]|uniref:Uncharacterized protein n=1 Tax=Salvia splendens TaxID=180675 RepID=A0A8X8Z7C7_SALSN|nr:hypothetical protein SASPL_145402 [Salvia splendens]